MEDEKIKNYLRAASALHVPLPKSGPQGYGVSLASYCIASNPSCLMPNAQYPMPDAIDGNYLPHPLPAPVPCSAFDFHTLFDCCATVAQHS